ncbi:Arf Gtpase-Activating Protein Git2 [Manis pentadactyla]|nr:Arf Gtpase-Activating Protein Git2 [Manis pentadactyla]
MWAWAHQSVLIAHGCCAQHSSYRLRSQAPHCSLTPEPPLLPWHFGQIRGGRSFIFDAYTTSEKIQIGVLPSTTLSPALNREQWGVGLREVTRQPLKALFLPCGPCLTKIHRVIVWPQHCVAACFSWSGAGLMEAEEKRQQCLLLSQALQTGEPRPRGSILPEAAQLRALQRLSYKGLRSS